MSYYLSYNYYNNKEYKDLCILELKDALNIGKSSWFSGLQLIINEISDIKEDNKSLNEFEMLSGRETLIREWQQFWRDNSTKKRTPEDAWELLRQKLLVGSHNEMADSLETLFSLMGFEVRPLREVKGEPDLLVFPTMGSEQYSFIIEVKSKQTDGSQIKVSDVDQISGHKTRYEHKYINYKIFPILFTNKEEIDSMAIEKAKDNVKIIRNADFTILMAKYFDLIKISREADDPMKRLGVMQKIPSTDNFLTIFRPSLNPIATLDEISSIFP
jgi:hypothetical protein